MFYPADIPLSLAHFLIPLWITKSESFDFSRQFSFLRDCSSIRSKAALCGRWWSRNYKEKTSFWFAVFLISWISAKAYENAGTTEWCSNSARGEGRHREWVVLLEVLCKPDNSL